MKVTYIVRGRHPFEDHYTETTSAGMDELVEELLDLGAEVDDIIIEVRL